MAVLAILGARMLMEPLQPYGDGAAQYIEHAVRLEVLEALEGHEGSTLHALRLADDTVLSHPPGLHLITLAAGSLTGHAAEEVLWTGPLWLLLLGLSLWACAGALGGNSRARTAALLGAVLLPAAHGAATRYHYDLPMTALLWASVAALLLSMRSRPLIGGLLAGALFALAAVVKWTALPFGVAMLVSAWLSGPEHIRGRSGKHAVAAAIVTALIGGGLVLTYLTLAPNSFDAGQLATEEGAAGLPSLSWYSLSLVTSVLSPLGALALIVPLGAWLLRDRRGWALVLGTCTGQLAFLALFVSRPDERFLLTLAPALVLAAALGWSSLQPPRRRLVGSAGLVLLMLVGLEFHLAPDLGWNQNREVREATERLPSLNHRGPFLADSFEGRGWSSSATTPTNDDALREELWSTLAACGVAEVAVEQAVSERGDIWWLRYRSSLDRLRSGEGSPLLVHGPVHLGRQHFWWPDPDTIADAPMHYSGLGFSRDLLPETLPEPQDDDPGDLRLLDSLGVLSSALAHFQPVVGVVQLPPAPESLFVAPWGLHRELSDPEGRQRIGVFVRGQAACRPTGPQSPGQR